MLDLPIPLARLVAVASLLAGLAPLARAQSPAVICEGCLTGNPVCINYPQGALSFADVVLTYDPNAMGGPAPTGSWTNSSAALGLPDFLCQHPGDVSLGNGGYIDLGFTNNLLTNGGTPQSPLDLWIYEVGPNIETMHVFVRPTAATKLLLSPALDPDGDGWYFTVTIAGQPSGVDLDSAFAGFAAGQLVFDAVRIQDAFNVNGTTGASVGADIDAVGAISSTPSGCPSVAFYCTAKTNSLGCTPAISSSGSTSLSGPDDFVLRAANVFNQKNGVLLIGTTQSATPFAGGTLCVQAPVKIVPVQSSGGSASSADCSGAFAVALRHVDFQSLGLGAGAAGYAQFLSRDPGFAEPDNLSLSNAAVFVVCP